MVEILLDLSKTQYLFRFASTQFSHSHFIIDCFLVLLESSNLKEVIISKSFTNFIIVLKIKNNIPIMR